MYLIPALLASWECDGYQDCDGGEDEANCGTPGACKY